ncbi:hypothetical protein MYX64_09680 [Nitrospinae bacterium AH_259_B05_G02_I21]|nr:hypothetical protein [Nitrospinae bacterium AH_259_B05_G02_I21]
MTKAFLEGGLCLLLVFAFACPAEAQTEFLGPSEYLCFDASTTTATNAAACVGKDSPFKDVDFSGGYFHFEDFEDGLLNTPGVTALGNPEFLSVVGPNPLTDSVDEDDGSIDGSGAGGHELFTGQPPAVEFTFDAGVLGHLPTHVGIVWTDGQPGETITFEAFDEAGTSLGTVTGNHADGTTFGTTAEDRFYGVIHGGGISKIRISDPFFQSGIEVDHLQYGLVPISVTNALCAEENVEVAVLTDDFDASTVDTQTLTFAGASPDECELKDVDGDADLDLVCEFSTENFSFTDAITEATLTGQTTDGTPITGSDTVRFIRDCDVED